MANLARIKQIHEKFASKATFLTVYVGEAHPVENEDFENKFEIKIHQNLSERLNAASKILKYLSHLKYLIFRRITEPR